MLIHPLQYIISHPHLRQLHYHLSHCHPHQVFPLQSSIITKRRKSMLAMPFGRVAIIKMDKILPWSSGISRPRRMASSLERVAMRLEISSSKEMLIQRVTRTSLNSTLAHTLSITQVSLMVKNWKANGRSTE